MEFRAVPSEPNSRDSCPTYLSFVTLISSVLAELPFPLSFCILAFVKKFSLVILRNAWLDVWARFDFEPDELTGEEMARLSADTFVELNVKPPLSCWCASPPGIYIPYLFKPRRYLLGWSTKRVWNESRAICLLVLQIRWNTSASITSISAGFNCFPVFMLPLITSLIAWSVF